MSCKRRYTNLLFLDPRSAIIRIAPVRLLQMSASAASTIQKERGETKSDVPLFESLCWTGTNKQKIQKTTCTTSEAWRQPVWFVFIEGLPDSTSQIVLHRPGQNSWKTFKTMHVQRCLNKKKSFNVLNFFKTVYTCQYVYTSIFWSSLF